MRRDEFPIVDKAIQEAVVKALEDVKAEIENYSYITDDEGYVHHRKYTNIWDAIDIINRKIKEIKNERDSN